MITLYGKVPPPRRIQLASDAEHHEVQFRQNACMAGGVAVHVRTRLAKTSSGERFAGMPAAH